MDLVFFEIAITIIDAFSELKKIITFATGQKIEFIAKKAFIALHSGRKLREN